MILTLWSITSCKEYASWTGALTLQGSWVYSFPNLNYGCYTFSSPTLPLVDISTESLTFTHIHESFWNQERPDKQFKPKINWKVFSNFSDYFLDFLTWAIFWRTVETILPTTEQEEMSVFFSLCTRIKFRHWRPAIVFISFINSHSSTSVIWCVWVSFSLMELIKIYSSQLSFKYHSTIWNKL